MSVSCIKYAAIFICDTNSRSAGVLFCDFMKRNIDFQTLVIYCEKGNKIGRCLMKIHVREAVIPFIANSLLITEFVEKRFSIQMPFSDFIGASISVLTVILFFLIHTWTNDVVSLIFLSLFYINIVTVFLSYVFAFLGGLLLIFADKKTTWELLRFSSYCLQS